MSTNKYADLPDIDTAPDVYETEDTFPSSRTGAVDPLDDDTFSRATGRGRQESGSREELDLSNMLSPEDASRKFRKAERKRERTKLLYAYPDSPDDPSSPVHAAGTPTPLPLSQRLRALQAELAALEHELADPSNPLIQKEREEANVDPGELIRGLVDVRSRLDRIVRGKEGRARLVDNIMHENQRGEGQTEQVFIHPDGKEFKPEPLKSGVQNLVNVDRRVEQLERLVGSSSTSLDDTTPLPPPLLPLITKLNSQLALLTQPRHIDSISRRLKLLLSDLDRASAAAQNHRRQGSRGDTDAPAPSNHEQLLVIVNRIAPSLPQIPHILSRLRTLSTLHAAAGEFQDTLKDLEQEQQKIRNGLQELQGAVETIEGSLEENRTVVKENVSGLDGRVNELLKWLEDIRRERDV